MERVQNVLFLLLQFYHLIDTEIEKALEISNFVHTYIDVYTLEFAQVRLLLN